MAVWETPRTDYTTDSSVNASDFERIEGNIEFIRETPTLFGTTGGTGSAYTLTIADVTAYGDGLSIIITFHITNTGADPTLNLNSLGAKVLKNASGGSFGIGELVGGQDYYFRYDSSAGYFKALTVTQALGTIAASNVSYDNSGVPSEFAQTNVQDLFDYTLPRFISNLKVLPDGSDLNDFRQTQIVTYTTALNQVEAFAYVLVVGGVVETHQLSFGTISGEIYYRKYQGGVGWTGWKLIIDSSNILTHILKGSTSGQNTYNQAIPANTTITITIPLGEGYYRYGKADIGGNALFDFSFQKDSGSVIITGGWLTDNVKWNYYKTNGGLITGVDDSNNILDTQEVTFGGIWIDGSDLKFELIGSSTGGTVNFTIDWTVTN